MGAISSLGIQIDKWKIYESADFFSKYILKVWVVIC